MNTVKVQKLKPIKSAQFPYNHILVHSVIALTCSTSLLCMFPSQGRFVKHFLFNTLPSFWRSFVNPKCLFIVVNVIVGFLIFGESRSTSSSSSAGDQIYEEYVKRKMELNLREKRVVGVNKTKPLEERDIAKVEDAEDEEIFEDVKEQEEEEEEEHKEEAVVDVDDDKEKERGRDEDSEDQGLPAEELNRRVEAFIARVNKRRWLEAKSLACCPEA